MNNNDIEIVSKEIINFLMIQIYLNHRNNWSGRKAKPPTNR